MSKKKAGVPAPPHADKGPDKVDVKTRVACSALVGTKGPKSPLWIANASLQDAGIYLVTAGVNLGASDTTYNDAFLALEAARTTKLTQQGIWDSAYDVFVTTAQKYAVKPEDLSNLGLHVLSRNVYPFAEPLAVELKYDHTVRVVRIHVKLPPGMETCEIEVSPDPITATSWKRMVGHGAKRELPSPAPGTYWVHAATTRATEQSAFTSPVSIVVP